MVNGHQLYGQSDGYLILNDGNKKEGILHSFHSNSKEILLNEGSGYNKYKRDDISDIVLFAEPDTLYFSKRPLYELEGKRLVELHNERWVAEWYGSDKLKVYCVYWKYSKAMVGSAGMIPFVIPRGSEYHVLQALEFEDTDKLILINLLTVPRYKKALFKLMQRLMNKHCPINLEWNKEELWGDNVEKYVEFYEQNCN